MGLIIGLVFIGVFTLIALPLAGMGPSSSAKQALATLDSAIKVDRRDLLPQKLNVRKNELLSSIPWLNEKLLKFELTPYLRRLLSQADLDWSAGRLLLVCAAGFVIPTYALLDDDRQPLIGVCDGRRAVRAAVMPLFCSSATGASARLKSICPRRWT